MKKIKLETADFISPNWLRKVSYRSFPAIVEDNAVSVEGTRLKLGEPLENGTAVRVYLAGQFYAALESEILAEEAKAAAVREQTAEDRRVSLNLRRREAEAFNSTINLPVAWRISQKEVLSGLSERSSGDGCYKNTVAHLELLADLNAGRLKRNKNDLLCTSKSGSNGHSWSGGNFGITYKDGDGAEYMPQPTCKQCLKLLKRFGQE